MISLDDSNLGIIFRLELSNGIAGFQNYPARSERINFPRVYGAPFSKRFSLTYPPTDRGEYVDKKINK